MAVQNLIGRYSSTLSGSYTSGGGSISVTSATGLPSGACNFYAIVKAEGANTEEVFLVTNVSGTTLTVTGAQEGTSASNHASGATIIAGIITTTFLKQYGYILVEEHTASSSSEIDFTTGITSDYDEYLITITDLQVSVAGAVVRWQASSNGGSTYDTGNNYSWSNANIVIGSTTTGSNGLTTVAGIEIFGDNSLVGPPASANPPGQFTLNFKNPNTTSHKVIYGLGVSKYNGNSNLYGFQTYGEYITSSAVNAFRFIPSSGNIASGAFRLFGLAK